MKKIITISNFLIIAILVMVISLNSDTTAVANGKGDGNREFACGSICHSAESPKTVINMDSSESSVIAGTEITVTVTIPSSEQSEGALLGILLASARASSGSIPTEAGWTIIQDPNGGTNNYVEVPADASGGATVEWTMKTPSAPGDYTLYVRDYHGNGGKYFKDYSEALVIEVTENPDLPGDGDNGGQNGDGSGGDGTTDGKTGNTTENGDSKTSGGNTLGLSDEPDVVPLLLGLIFAALIVFITYLLRH
jgi:hypothetical protein